MVWRAPRARREGWPVSQIHCHFCGGIIQDVATIEYRPPRASAQFAMPQPTPCNCSPPVVYEHPPVLGGPEEDQTPDGEADWKKNTAPPETGGAERFKVAW